MADAPETGGGKIFDIGEDRPADPPPADVDRQPSSAEAAVNVLGLLSRIQNLEGLAASERTQRILERQAFELAIATAKEGAEAEERILVLNAKEAEREIFLLKRNLGIRRKLLDEVKNRTVGHLASAEAIRRNLDELEFTNKDPVMSLTSSLIVALSKLLDIIARV